MCPTVFVCLNAGLFVLIAVLFPFTISAMKVAILGLDKTVQGEWIRVTVNVMTRYKRALVRLRLGNEFLWIPRQDYKCKCPKLRPGRQYLIAGSIRSTRRKKSIVVDHRSMVVAWNQNLVRKVDRIKRNCQNEKDTVERHNWSKPTKLQLVELQLTSLDCPTERTWETDPSAHKYEVVHPGGVSTFRIVLDAVKRVCVGSSLSHQEIFRLRINREDAFFVLTGKKDKTLNLHRNKGRLRAY